MPSRRDNVQSYRFLLQRVVSAQVMRDTDPAQTPLRRGNGAAFAGVMAAVILAAGFGIYGLVARTGTNGWQANGAVIIEKETGTPFVYQDNELVPALNYTSARLLSSAADPKVHSVPRKKLAGIPRGVERGIVGAPSALPPAKSLVAAPWTFCSIQRTTSSGGTATSTGVAVGRAPLGGRPLGDQALLAQDAPDGGQVSTYLVWHDHRYRIVNPEDVVPALFGNQAEPTIAGRTWLDALPQGQDISPLPVPGRGQQSRTLPGHDVGDLVYYENGSGRRQYFVVFDDGIAALTPMQADIALGELDGKAANVPLPRLNATRRSTKLPQPPPAEQRPPVATPVLAATEGGGVCSQAQNAATAPLVTVDATFPAATQGGITQSQTSLGAVPTQDSTVSVPPGGGAVVRAVTSSTATDGTLTLITDAGLRYGISPEVLRKLGYGEGQVVTMPVTLVEQVPVGPALTVQAATHAAGTTTN